MHGAYVIPHVLACNPIRCFLVGCPSEHRAHLCTAVLCRSAAAEAAAGPGTPATPQGAAGASQGAFSPFQSPSTPDQRSPHSRLSSPFQLQAGRSADADFMAGKRPLPSVYTPTGCMLPHRIEGHSSACTET
jgi:hypothetical protein